MNKEKKVSRLRKRRKKIKNFPRWVPGISGVGGWLVAGWGFITGILTKRENSSYGLAFANDVAAHCAAYANNLVALYEHRVSPLKVENAELTEDFIHIEKSIALTLEPRPYDTEETLKRRIAYGILAIEDNRACQWAINVRIAGNNEAIESMGRQVVQYQERAVSKACAKIHRFLRGHAKAGVKVEAMDEDVVRKIVAGSFKVYCSNETRGDD